MDLLSELLGLSLKPIAAAPVRPVAATAPAAIAPAPTTGEASSEAIPTDCMTFVESEEDGSPTYYVAHYTHWEWPAGASGPTLAVGYDCGYVTAAEAQADWSGIVDDATLAQILRAVGLRGSAAEAFVNANRSAVTITWPQAESEFKAREVPKWLDRCRAALPNFDLLPGECQGSIFSLTYNRGQGGYTVSAADDPAGRYREMRAIRADMIAKDFAAIPAQILSMQRLWPRGGDLWNRRAHEAALFQKGLAS